MFNLNDCCYFESCVQDWVSQELLAKLKEIKRDKLQVFQRSARFVLFGCHFTVLYINVPIPNTPSYLLVHGLKRLVVLLLVIFRTLTRKS